MMTIICTVGGRKNISEASGALVNFNGRGQPTAEYVHSKLHMPMDVCLPYSMDDAMKQFG